MVISEDLRGKIQEKADIYDGAKEEIKAKIENNIDTAIEILKSIKRELIDEIDREFGRNPFTEFLNRDNSLTDADAERLLDEQKIPENHGPDEKTFSALFRAIDSLREWRIFTPKNLKVEGTTWDSITLSWDKVSGASFYQVEMDGNKFWDAPTTNAFTKRGLLPKTKHSFKVRAVRGGSVSKWSDVVKGKTVKESFKTCMWKECPGDIDNDRKYSVDEKNPRVTTKINIDGWCTIIGNTTIPLNTVTSWNIKVLKSKDNNGDGIFIGVAPSDINQNDVNYNECGWYFDCYWSTLRSGPPHRYSGKEYGQRKERGQYVHTGDSVGVVMDTTKGELSFALDGPKCNVAYKGIPLDKPLVPCVLLYYPEDSVEFVI